MFFDLVTLRRSGWLWRFCVATMICCWSSDGSLRRRQIWKPVRRRSRTEMEIWGCHCSHHVCIFFILFLKHQRMTKILQEQEEHAALGPRPPPFPPPGPDEMAQPVGIDDLPMPPAFPPQPDEDPLDGATVAQAVERGPQECVRQLVPWLKERIWLLEL